MPLVVRNEEVEPKGPDTEHPYSGNPTTASAHPVALIESQKNKRKTGILRPLATNLKQPESKVDEIIRKIEVIIGKEKKGKRSILSVLRLGLQGQLYTQCRDTKILIKKLKEDPSSDPSSDPSLSLWWLHRLHRLVDRANVAIREIGFILGDNKTFRMDEIPMPKLPVPSWWDDPQHQARAEFKHKIPEKENQLAEEDEKTRIEKNADSESNPSPRSEERKTSESNSPDHTTNLRGKNRETTGKSDDRPEANQEALCTRIGLASI
jgi:hypothetical protein